MRFEEVIGHTEAKNRLIRTVKENRISHAQMFLGPSGTGKLAMAIAYAQYINCNKKEGNDSCGVCPSCVKYEKLAHPDLHFLFPTAKKDNSDKQISSLDYLKEWREVLLEKHQYITLTDWYEKINIERKQAIINVRDCNNLIRTLSYKNYEADYKVMIIWMVEKLFHSAGPKILKILEEPPDHTLFILLAEDTEPVLPTILSRTQIVRFPPIDSDSLLKYHIQQGVNPQLANDAIRVYAGDYIKTHRMIHAASEEDKNFQLFRQWMRVCFRGDMEEMIRFVKGLVKNTREFQKSLLLYSLRMVRETFLANQDNPELNRMNNKENELVGNFSPFIHARNIGLFNDELNQAIHHVARNVNSSIIFLDMSLKFMKYLKM